MTHAQAEHALTPVSKQLRPQREKFKLLGLTTRGTVKKNGWSTEDEFRLGNMLIAGLTTDQIGQVFGLTGAGVLYRMRKADLIPKQRSLQRRFDSQYMPEPNSGCWIWCGYANSNGYGIIHAHNRTMLATHISLELIGRPLPRGLHALHHCDNPPCVNPDHLFPGTDMDNYQDSIRKGRRK